MTSNRDRASVDVGFCGDIIKEARVSILEPQQLLVLKTLGNTVLFSLALVRVASSAVSKFVNIY